ncbi:DUF916 and DUF3324 domain-containing protein [Bombilactobacillus folatiphilus]|uniref:DUF916 and DUF3324 domain-containing protein n=1 Tax=Bombilactobacillus folatiphilus TaxID=2923362 RepID=A0ABY4P8A4_9LACO|nr:DUF3324 domain-containing protein [Bombilactobacillus folatiphilus]UQS81847.1 DUF916 and DUF3324 domain-containing protein [Bombilactobacillus folatiphilus]
MNKWLQRLVLLLTMVCGICLVKPVHAEITGAAGFSVEPIDNQGNTGQGSYFLKNVQDGTSYPLQLKLTNNKKYSIKIVVKPTVAGTTSQGQINYSNLSTKRDDSLKYDWTKMGPTKQTVKLAPHASQTITETLNVKAPNFNGVMLGSFYLYSPTIDNHTKHKKSKSTVSLNNVYSYSVSSLFKVGNVDQAQPDLRLNRVRTGLVGTQPAVYLDLQNFKPKYITNDDMRVNAKIYTANSNKLVVHRSQKQMNFAPNSTFGYPVSWGNMPMKAGNYQARVWVKTSARSWYFKKNFTISPKDANKYNRNNPYTKRNYWPFIILIIVILVLLIGGLFYWFYKRGQKQASK